MSALDRSLWWWSRTSSVPLHARVRVPSLHVGTRGQGRGCRVGWSFRCRCPCRAARHSGCDIALRRGIVGAGGDPETARCMCLLPGSDVKRIQALHGPVRGFTGKILALHFQDLSSGCGGLSSVSSALCLVGGSSSETLHDQDPAGANLTMNLG